MTTSADTLTGTANNDTFRSADTTLSVADQLDGGAGTDSLYFTDSSNAGGIPAASFSNIENYYIRNVQTANAGETYDFSAIAGEVEVWSDRSTDSVTFDNLGTSTVVGLQGDNNTVLGAVTFQYATASDAVSIKIDGGVGKSGTAPAITENGSNGTATTATIASTGAANVVGTVDLAAATITSATINATTNLKGDFFSQATDQMGTDATLTVSGAATTVELTAALDNTLKTIDASGLTAGGVIVQLGTGTKAFTGGAGNDSVKTAGISDATINAGAGTDTLIVGAAADVDTAAERNQYSGFEVINVGAATDLAINNFSGATSVVLSVDDSGATGMDATQAAAVTVTADNTTANVLALATATGTSDVLGVTLQNATATSSADLTNLTATGFETMNVVSSSGTKGTATAAGANDLAFAAAGDLTAINVSGEYDLDIATANITKAVTITSTQSGTAALSVAGNLATGSTVTGSSQGDTFALGTAGSTYNGGAGDDSYTATAITLLENSGAFNTINGGDGTDTLTFTANSLAMVDSNFSKMTNMEKLTITASGGAGDITMTTGGFFDTNFKTNGVTLTLAVGNEDAITVDASTFTGAATVVATNDSASDAAGEGVSIKTGSGADNVTVTASNWVGQAGATSTILVDTGAGNDTISVTTGTAVTDATTANQKVIDAGAGADTITLAGVNHTTGESYYQLKVQAGDSTKTAYDSVTGFDKADGTKISDAIDFDTASVTGAVAATAVTGNTAAELTVALTVTTGLAVFAGTKASSITVAQALDAIDQVITDGKTAIWNDGTDTYVYNSDASGDSVVKLVGVVGTALIAAEATTADGIAIM